jgi:hypothetical protein
VVDMDINKKLQEFNKRWAIIDDSSYEEEFIKFKKRVLNIFSDIDSHVTKEDIKKFCQILGITLKWEHSYSGSGGWSENIINAFIQENDDKRFYRLLQVISFLPIIESFKSYETPYSREIIFSQLAEAIEFSNINFAMTVKNGEIIFHPKGEAILDKLLVDEVISFLNIECQKHFIEALNLYSNFSPKNAIKSAESIRRSLEEFLRFKLQNQKGLKENIVELQKRLKIDKRDPFLRNTIFYTFSSLDQYFNENSKHNDGDINKPENEFLIYQIGLLMRYIHNVIS